VPEDRPDVFAYLDYRAYLRDHYRWGKKHRNLSHRAFARRAGVKSPSFLKRVMESKRNLSEQSAERVGEACRLEGEALTYFQDLVRFNQAKTSDERRVAYERLQGFARYRRVHTLEVHRDAYHAHWYLPAIRELAGSPLFRDDPKWIANNLRPRIKVSEAKAALRTLEEMGLLERDEDGALRQTDAIVSTGPETASVHLARFHKGMIARGAASIDEFPSPERDISSLTLCVDANGLQRLKRRIQAFRRELLLDDALSEGLARQVVQVNFQLFPLSAVVEDET